MNEARRTQTLKNQPSTAQKVYPVVPVGIDKALPVSQLCTVARESHGVMLNHKQISKCLHLLKESKLVSQTKDGNWFNPSKPVESSHTIPVKGIDKPLSQPTVVGSAKEWINYMRQSNLVRGKGDNASLVSMASELLVAAGQELMGDYDKLVAENHRIRKELDITQGDLKAAESLLNKESSAYAKLEKVQVKLDESNAARVEIQRKYNEALDVVKKYDVIKNALA